MHVKVLHRFAEGACAALRGAEVDELCEHIACDHLIVVLYRGQRIVTTAFLCTHNADFPSERQKEVCLLSRFVILKHRLHVVFDAARISAFGHDRIRHTDTETLVGNRIDAVYVVLDEPVFVRAAKNRDPFEVVALSVHREQNDLIARDLERRVIPALPRTLHDRHEFVVLIDVPLPHGRLRTMCDLLQDELAAIDLIYHFHQLVSEVETEQRVREKHLEVDPLEEVVFEELLHLLVLGFDAPSRSADRELEHRENRMDLCIGATHLIIRLRRRASLQ